jgi:hypothetical protein
MTEKGISTRFLVFCCFSESMLECCPSIQNAAKANNPAAETPTNIRKFDLRVIRHLLQASLGLSMRDISLPKARVAP